MSSHHARIVGPWTLSDPLGEGGNGGVWRAIRSDGVEAAIKILHPRFQQAAHPRFGRFRDEITTHRRLTGRPGILPVLDANLPDDPTMDNPGWLVTALATPVKKALRDSGLVEAVLAVAKFAECLASLHSEGISHRDIKPSNLYQYEGHWVLGDFGLVSFPDKEGITASGDKLGPANFLAPEMLTDAKHAFGAPADVYSLAKTLWVLATGQNYPPGGELRVDVPSLTIRGYVMHQKVQYLDRLIERATRHDAARRPSMREVAEELAVWLTPSAAPTPVANLADIAARIAAVSAATQPAEESRRFRVSEAERIFSLLQERIDRYGQIAGETAGGARIHSGVEGTAQKFIDPIRLRFRCDWQNNHAFILHGPGSEPVVLRLCLWVGATLRDTIVIFAGYWLDRSGCGDHVSIWHDIWEAAVGSSLLEANVTTVESVLSEQLAVSLSAFADAIEARYK